MRRLLAAVAAAVLLSACTSPPEAPADDPTPSPSTSPASTAESTPPDPVPTPRVGECHALTLRQAVAMVGRTAPVRCRRPHTAQTYFVGRLDLATTSGFTRRVDSRAAQRQTSRACTTRLPRHLGRTPRELRLSMVRAVWFTPSPVRAEAGADWFRCDIVAVARPGTLLRLPRRTKGWDGPAMCATAAPGTRGFRRVTCGAEHTWRAVATVDVPGRTLPGRDAVAARMDPVCRDVSEDLTDDPLDLTWSQESPTREQWDAGQRYGICWVPA